MSLITNYDDLVVIVSPERAPTANTVVRRCQQLEQLAWTEFVNGPRERTPRSAMARAQRRYLAELGRWVKNCAVCGVAFTSKRCDAITCTEACRKRQQRERKRTAS